VPPVKMTGWLTYLNLQGGSVPTSHLELAFYRCWSPRPVNPADRVTVAGIRSVEESFQAGKSQVGLV
jgi:hypothetical protein